MADQAKDSFRQELDRFSARLDNAKRQWQQERSLGETEHRKIEEIEARHGVLHHKAAAQEDSVWHTLESEFRQAFDTVIADFEHLADNLDHEKNKPG
jgi:hypothetical protein